MHAATLLSEYCWRYGQVCFLGEGSGVYQGCPRTNGSTTQNVPPVVFICMNSAPRHIARYGVCRYAPLPSVATHQKGGTIKGGHTMGAGKGMAVAPTGLIGHLGTIFLDARIEAVIHCDASGCAQCQLHNALAVFLNKGLYQSRGSRCKAQYISAAIHKFVLPKSRCMEADNSNEPEDDSSEIHLYVCLGWFYKLVSMEGRDSMLLGCLHASRTISFCFIQLHSPLRSFMKNKYLRHDSRGVILAHRKLIYRTYLQKVMVGSYQFLMILYMLVCFK